MCTGGSEVEEIAGRGQRKEAQVRLEKDKHAGSRETSHAGANEISGQKCAKRGGGEKKKRNRGGQQVTEATKDRFRKSTN